MHSGLGAWDQGRAGWEISRRLSLSSLKAEDSALFVGPEKLAFSSGLKPLPGLPPSVSQALSSPAFRG